MPDFGSGKATTIGTTGQVADNHTAAFRNVSPTREDLLVGPHPESAKETTTLGGDRLPVVAGATAQVINGLPVPRLPLPG